MKKIKELFFGVKASGELISAPTPKPTRSLIDDEFNKWTQEYKFGARYGHKGSFYQRGNSISY